MTGPTTNDQVTTPFSHSCLCGAVFYYQTGKHSQSSKGEDRVRVRGELPFLLHKPYAPSNDLCILGVCGCPVSKISWKFYGTPCMLKCMSQSLFLKSCLSRMCLQVYLPAIQSVNASYHQQEASPPRHSKWELRLNLKATVFAALGLLSLHQGASPKP